MGIVSSKDVILGKVRNALSKKTQKLENKPDFNQSLYPVVTEDLTILFAENLVASKSEFFFCEDTEDFKKQFYSLLKERNMKNIAVLEKDLIDILPKMPKPYLISIQDVLKADVGVNLCESFIARLGSILISSKQMAGRRLSVYPPINIVVGYSSQIVFDIKDGLKRLVDKYNSNYPSMICLTTGPSRTADIEKTLVLGAHGPKELLVFLIDDSTDL